MSRKIITFSMIIGFLLVLVAGCSSKAEGEAQTEIRFLQKWPEPEYAPFFEKVVEEYEKENPDIKIKMEAVGDDPIKDKLRTSIGGGDAPDVTFSWSGEFLQKFIDAGVALDLTEYLNENEEWNDSFIPAALDAFTSDGKNYGVPIRLVGKFFLYNKSIFDEYQLEEPATWEEFEDVMEKLKDEGVTPIYFGNESSWASIHYITGFNQKFVAEDVIEKDYTPQTGEFTDEGYVKSLKLLKELNDKGYFNDNVNTTNHDLAKENFFQENGAIIYLETEEFIDVENGLPNDWGFFPMPAITEGDGNQNFITGAPDGFIVSANSKHPDEAVDFLKYLTSKETQEMMVEMISWNSSVKGTLNEDNSMEQSAKAQEDIENAEGLSQWLDTALNSKIADVYLNNMQPLLNGDVTAEEVMKEVQKEAEKVKEDAK